MVLDQYSSNKIKHNEVPFPPHHLHNDAKKSGNECGQKIIINFLSYFPMEFLLHSPLKYQMKPLNSLIQYVLHANSFNSQLKIASSHHHLNDYHDHYTKSLE